ncbi:MAG: hypothetical protein H6727_03700 [Myxococcales bacterium]|nr:hypothetical protein [Myxococcales bacterium]
MRVGSLRLIGFLAALWCFSLSAPAHADDFQKAISHYKNFEIREALTIFENLSKSSSGSQKAKALLYVGLCHAYLRDREKALSAMKQAIQQERSIGLPAQTPGRLSELFNEARRQSGLSGDAPTMRNDPPPVRRDPPMERRDPPPERRKMTFGDFSVVVRRRPPPERRVEEPPPPERRRVVEPPPPERRVEEPPPPERRRVEEPPPPERRRKVAVRDPILPDGDKDPLMDDPGKSKKKGGGPNVMVIVGGVAAGLAAACLGGAIFMGVRANSTIEIGKRQDSFQIDLPTIQKDADGMAVVANVLYGAAGALAVGAIIFFVLSPRFAPKSPAKTSALPPASPKDIQKAQSQGNHILFSSTL